MAEARAMPLRMIRSLRRPRRRTRRMSLKRMATYYRHRIARLPGTPSSIALGFALGMGISVTPFIGFHILMGLVVSYVFRASTVAMIIGTVVGGNPWTFPFLWFVTYHIGGRMLAYDTAGGAPSRDLSFSDLIHHPVDLLLPMTLGSLPLAALFGVVSYYAVRPLIARYRSQRHERLSARRLREDDEEDAA